MSCASTIKKNNYIHLIKAHLHVSMLAIKYAIDIRQDHLNVCYI